MKKFVSLFMVMAMCVCMMAGCGDPRRREHN